jgi:hypothetical protein
VIAHQEDGPKIGTAIGAEPLDGLARLRATIDDIAEE